MVGVDNPRSYIARPSAALVYENVWVEFFAACAHRNCWWNESAWDSDSVLVSILLPKISYHHRWRNPSASLSHTHILPLSISIYLSICLSLSLSVSLYLYLSLSIFICVCLCVSLFYRPQYLYLSFYSCISLFSIYRFYLWACTYL